MNNAQDERNSLSFPSQSNQGYLIVEDSDLYFYLFIVIISQATGPLINVTFTMDAAAKEARNVSDFQINLV